MSRVVLIDDHQVLADCLRLALIARGVPDVTTLSPADGDLPTRIASLEARDLALVDLDLSGAGNDGVELIPLLTGRGITAIVFTGSTDHATFGRCLEQGAVGVIHKSKPFDVVVEDVMGALRGESVNSEAEKYDWLLEATRQSRALQRAMAPFERLTNREAEVLGDLLQGLHADDIAKTSCVSVVTVRSQIRAILQKLEVSSQLEAVAAAHRCGWRPPLATGR
jgi:two-component system nitrate/nitrite response regulator NarL